MLIKILPSKDVSEKVEKLNKRKKKSKKLKRSFPDLKKLERNLLRKGISRKQLNSRAILPTQVQSYQLKGNPINLEFQIQSFKDFSKNCGTSKEFTKETN